MLHFYLLSCNLDILTEAAVAYRWKQGAKIRGKQATKWGYATLLHQAQKVRQKARIAFSSLHCSPQVLAVQYLSASLLAWEVERWSAGTADDAGSCVASCIHVLLGEC